MRKKSMRLVSAALAACMMTSVLPVGAFALDMGAVPESSVSTQAAAENILPFEGKEITTGGTYIMPTGVYTGNIVINTDDADAEVIIKITGKITYDNPNVPENDDRPLFDAKQVGKLTIEGGQYEIISKTECAVACQKNVSVKKVVLKGGNYTVEGDEPVIYFDTPCIAELNSVEANGTTNVVFSTYSGGAQLTIDGGKYEGSGTLPVIMISGGHTDIINGTEVTSKGNTAVYAKYGRGSVTINGGKYTSKAAGSYALGVAGGTIDVTNATVIGEGTGVYVGTPIKGYDTTSGKITLTNTTVTTEKGCPVYNNGTASGTVEINGGTYTSNSTSVCVNTFAGSTTKIHGGTFEGEGTVICSRGTMTIDGAKNVIRVTGSQTDAPRVGVRTEANSTTTIGGATIENAQYGIWNKDGTAEVTLNDVAFKNNESDIYLEANQTVTTTDNFTGRATVKVADDSVAEGHAVTTTSNPAKRNLVSTHAGYRVAYNAEDGHYYLTQRTADKITVDAEDATAKLEDDTELDANTEIDKGTRVNLTAVTPGTGWEFIGWELKVNGEDMTTKLLKDADTENPYFVIPADMDAESVTVRALYNFVGTDDGTASASAGGAIAAVAVGAAAAWGVYEAGTGIYRVVNMKGIPMPANRGELAMLIWEKAGKPEPAGTALYADIDADNTDLQKAAHWVVEQGLMDEKADNTFKPNTHVTKLRTCTTWEKAKQKGLFD